MKQHIDSDQFKELSAKGKDNLRNHYEDIGLRPGDYFLNIKEDCIYIVDEYDINFSNGDLPLLSIGQIIEFLGTDMDSIENEGTDWIVNKYSKGAIYEWTKRIELVDALWQAMKEVLEK